MVRRSLGRSFAACQITLVSTSMVMFLASTSNVFGAVFARFGTATWITNALLAIPLPPWGTMALVLLLIFLLGWPFEWPAIVLIFMPMLAPVVAKLGYDMVYFGAISAVVMQTAFLSPPVAMAAYYLKQVVKEWSLSTIFRGMFDFMWIQCIAVVLVLAFPGIAMWLPNWLEEAPSSVVVPAGTEEAAERDSLEERDSLKAGEPEPPAANEDTSSKSTGSRK